MSTGPTTGAPRPPTGDAAPATLARSTSTLWILGKDVEFTNMKLMVLGLIIAGCLQGVNAPPSILFGADEHLSKKMILHGTFGKIFYLCSINVCFFSSLITLGLVLYKLKLNLELFGILFFCLVLYVAANLSITPSSHSGKLVTLSYVIPIFFMYNINDCIASATASPPRPREKSEKELLSEIAEHLLRISTILEEGHAARPEIAPGNAPEHEIVIVEA